MAGLNLATTFVAGRQIVLNGISYQPGDSIPTSVVKGLRNASSLLSSRRIIPNVDQHNRHNRASTPTPTDMGAWIRVAP